MLERWQKNLQLNYCSQTFDSNQIETKQKTVRVIHSVIITKTFLYSENMWVSYSKVFLWNNFLPAHIEKKKLLFNNFSSAESLWL